MVDIFATFEELKRSNTEGVDFRIDYRKGRLNNILLMAPHGGKIEPGTTEIANNISQTSNCSFYSFLGTKLCGNSILHITSENFNEPIALELVQEHNLVITIHGCKGTDDTIYIGGGNSLLRDSLIQKFRDNGFNAPNFSTNLRFQGTSQNNICNKGRGPGVQIEITRALRDKLLEYEELLKTFSLVIDSAIQDHNNSYPVE